MSDVAALFPEVIEFGRLRAELAASGYVEKENHNELRGGARIRRRAEQYPEAFDHGTGVVLVVMERPHSSWSQTYGGPDVELIVLKDKPLLTGMSRLAQLANYHVAAVHVAAVHGYAPPGE